MTHRHKYTPELNPSVPSLLLLGPLPAGSFDRSSTELPTTAEKKSGQMGNLKKLNTGLLVKPIKTKLGRVYTIKPANLEACRSLLQVEEALWRPEAAWHLGGEILKQRIMCVNNWNNTSLKTKHLS